MAQLRVKSEVRQFIKSLRLKERNWEVRMLKSGHLELRDMNRDRVVATIPGSPSDFRWRKNQESLIRKYEQATQDRSHTKSA